MIRGIHHVGMNCRDLDRMKKFYMDAFGFNGAVATNVFRYVPRIPGVDHGQLFYFVMLVLTLAYLLAATFAEPALWLDPLGPLVKVVPSILLALTALAILDER